MSLIGIERRGPPVMCSVVSWWTSGAPPLIEHGMVSNWLERGLSGGGYEMRVAQMRGLLVMVDVLGRGLLLVHELALKGGSGRGSRGGRIRWVFLEFGGGILLMIGGRCGRYSVYIDGGRLEMRSGWRFHRHLD